MDFLSICSGIEAASVAWEPLGWRAVGFGEIEPFPSAVLAHHYPHTPNFGDITNYEQWNIEKPFRKLVGGTPCQGFSVAGLRGGLDDPRSNLALVYLNIAARFRPWWVVWENVPGCLSTNGGRDFGTFLGKLGKLGYGYAYRVLDAQYFGVPQRRRRVFVVGCLGGWRLAASVLFERQSLSGNPPPRRDAGKDIAPTLSARSKGGGGLGTDFDCDGGLIASNSEGTTGLPFLTASNVGKMVNNQTPLIARALSMRGRDGGYTAELSDVPSALHAGSGGGSRGFVLAPAGATAFSCKDYAQDASQEIAPTLRAMGHAESHQNAGGQLAIATPRAVRRLTPRECERLQGFPDDYTAIPWRGRLAVECPDGPRYKALGNSKAVPVVRWIGQRIALVDAKFCQ